MKTCASCNYANKDNALICSECLKVLIRDPDRKEWFYVEDEQPKGPFSLQEMAFLMNDGKLESDVLVWRKDMADWVPLNETILISLYEQIEQIKEKKAAQAAQSSTSNINSQDVNTMPQGNFSPNNGQPNGYYPNQNPYQPHPAQNPQQGYGQNPNNFQPQPGYNPYQNPGQPVQNQGYNPYNQPAQNPVQNPQGYQQQGFAQQAQPQVQELQWYYIENGAASQPVGKDQIIAMIQSGKLNKDSYVWNETMTDWTQVSKTDLMNAQNLHGNQAQNPVNGQAQTVAQVTGSFKKEKRVPLTTTSVKPRTDAIFIMVSLFTAGLFNIVWFGMIASSVDKLSHETGHKQLFSPIGAVILDIMTLGVYGMFYNWKMARVLNNIDPIQEDNTAAVVFSSLFTPVLAILLSWYICQILLLGMGIIIELPLTIALYLFFKSIPYAILQDQINDIVS